MDRLWHRIATANNERGWLLFWLAWSLSISAIYWIFGPHSYLRIQDNADFNIPYRIAAAKDLLHHGLTYWQPKFSGGMPAMVHPMFDNFLIDGVPYLLLPAWLVHGMVMWLQRFLAGYMTFRLCRGPLQMDGIAALFVGMSFSLYLWSVQDWKLVEALGMPAIALTLWVLERLLGMRVWHGVVLSLGFGVVFATVSQTFIFTFFFLGAVPFWFWIVRQVRWSVLLPCYGAFVVGVLLTEAPQLIALLSYRPSTARFLLSTDGESVPAFMESVRHAWQIMGWSDVPRNGLYYGLWILGMVLTRTDPARNLAWRLLILFLLSGVGAELLYAVQRGFSWFIPTSSGNLLDLNQFTVFVGPLLGGIGVHLLRVHLEQTPSVWVKPLLRGVLLMALAVPVYYGFHVSYLLSYRLATDNFAVNFQNPLLQELGQKQARVLPPERVVTVGTWPPRITAASGDRIYPAYVYAYGLENADGYYRLHSARYHRLWRRIIKKTLNHYPEVDRRTSTWYYLFQPPLPRFVSRAPLIMQDWYNLDLLSLANTRYMISHWPLEHSDLTLRHHPEQELREGQAWERLGRRDQLWQTWLGNVPHHALYLYENRNVLPRAFLVSRVRVVPDATRLLDEMEQTPAEGLRQIAFLEQPLASEINPGLTQAEVNCELYTPDRMQWRVRSNGPGVLVVTNNYDPYWRVTINGKSGTIIPVDHAFQGVVLEAGEHQVVLEYWPPYRPGSS
ncbi:MAG: YfhO family protein [Magnetococcales bacterium]|nr:YfhO family protein [Magnetococcales bacterium]